MIGTFHRLIGKHLSRLMSFLCVAYFHLPIIRGYLFLNSK